MKKNLLFLPLILALCIGAQAMQAPREGYDFTRPEDIQARAWEDGINLSFYDAAPIANAHLLGALGIKNPNDLSTYTFLNRPIAPSFIPIGYRLTVQQAQKIIEKTFLTGLINPLEIMAKARELGIDITFADAKRIAEKESFLEAFRAWISPADIKAHATEIGYPMTDQEARNLSIDLFERRIAPN